MDYGILKGRSPSIVGKLREYSVMVLIKKKKRSFRDSCNEPLKVLYDDVIVFEKRALTLKNQPGDIAFPGGRVEEGEEPYEAAIRETSEELGISENEIELLGPLDYFVTPNRYIIYPFAGIYCGEDFNFSEDEVERVIEVPVSYLLNQVPHEYLVEVKQLPGDDFPYSRINGGKDYPFYKGHNTQYFYYAGEDTVWGLTAAILRNFLTIIKESDK